MIELSVENLHLTYGDNPVLKGVSMELRRGKSSRCSAHRGAEKPRCCGRSPGWRSPPAARSLSVKPAFMTATRVVKFRRRSVTWVWCSSPTPCGRIKRYLRTWLTLRLRKVAAAEIKQRVQSVLDQLGLGHLGNRHPHQLSGGQQQRVAIGRALVYNPPVILLDEPLSNLDAKLREEARVFLRELIVKLGLSALMVTHDQNEAMAISDRILLLNNGVIEQQGTPQEMYGSPRTLFAAEFMGSNNRLHGTVTDLDNGRARIEGASWALWGMAGEGVSVGAEATAVIRVERLRIASSPEENMLELALLTSMYLGDRWEYLFRTEGDDFAIRAYGSALRDAERCHLTLPVNDLWIFPKG